MEIDQQAPLVASQEMFIEASPETIWKLQTNINAWNEWQPDVSKSTLAGPLAVGSVFNWRAGGLNITSTLQVVQSMRQIGWTGKALGLQVRHLWMFRPQENGTLVRTEESMEGWLATLLRFVWPKFLEESLDKALKTLKSKAESSSNRI
jgi:hypothetical protein